MAKKATAANAAQDPEIVPPVANTQGYDFSEDAGAGMDNVHSSDLSIPYLMILQDGSPEVKRTHKDYLTKKIEGARAGHIINTLTREILNEDVENDAFEFVPCFYQKAWMEWKSRDNGGGIVGSHPDESILRATKNNDKGQDVLPNGNIIATTAYFFGYYIRNDEPVRVILSMTSTQLKKARAWLSTATSIRMTKPDGTKYMPPLFSHKYNLSAVPESNAKGSWYGWHVRMAGPLSDPMLIDTGRSVVKDQREGALRLGNGAPEPDAEVGG